VCNPKGMCVQWCREGQCVCKCGVRAAKAVRQVGKGLQGKGGARQAGRQ